MHVLYVIDSLMRGGAEQSLAALAPHYRDRGIELTVAHLRDGEGVQAELLAAGAALVSLGDRKGRIAWTMGVRNLVREWRPDLVHTTLFDADVTGRVAGRLARVPVVSSLVTEHYGREHVHSPGLAPGKVRAAQLADCATARLATRFHAVSRHVADVMAARLRVRRDRIDVIPRGRDARQLGRRTASRRARARRALGVEPRQVLVLSVARQEPAKGLDVLLDAGPRLGELLPGVRVVVAGPPGRATRDLRDRGSDGGPETTWLGERDDVADLLTAADVFVLPSRREGSPGALMEAMALEAPIVATDLPQIREVADRDCARLVPVDRPEALAEAVAEVVRRPEETAARTRRARRRFLSEYAIERIADQMVAFYDRAVPAITVR